MGASGAIAFGLGVLVTGGGAGMPIGAICATAGFAANPPRIVNHSKELGRSLMVPTNLFISNDNPASSLINTWQFAAPPVAFTTQWT